MKTFLGFTTGLFTGLIVGIGITAVLIDEDKNFREYVFKSTEKADEPEV